MTSDLSHVRRLTEKIAELERENTTLLVALREWRLAFCEFCGDDNMSLHAFDKARDLTIEVFDGSLPDTTSGHEEPHGPTE